MSQKHFSVVDDRAKKNSMKLFMFEQTSSIFVYMSPLIGEKCAINKQILLSVNCMKTYFVMLDLLCLSNYNDGNKYEHLSKLRLLCTHFTDVFNFSADTFHYIVIAGVRSFDFYANHTHKSCFIRDFIKSSS